MMLKQLFSAKPAKRSPRLCLLILCLFILDHTPAMGQGMVKSTADTVLLSRFEYTQKLTNNGSDCICSITNTSQANIATIVLTGAPDKDTILFDSTMAFNGTHVLKSGQQIIAVGDFKGNQITVINLSLLGVAILVMLFCPG